MAANRHSLFYSRGSNAAPPRREGKSSRYPNSDNRLLDALTPVDGSRVKPRGLFHKEDFKQWHDGLSLSLD